VELESLGREDSEFAPIIKKTGNVLAKLKKLGKAYNAIREYLPLPLPKIPPFLIGEDN